jgi:hypothetical protein
MFHEPQSHSARRGQIVATLRGVTLIQSPIKEHFFHEVDTGLDEQLGSTRVIL